MWNLQKGLAICPISSGSAAMVEDPRGISTSSCFLGESNLSHPCGKQQERTGFQCCWQRGDTEKSQPCTWKSRSLRDCQIKPWSVETYGHAIEINKSKYFANWFVPSCITKPVTISPCWILVAQMKTLKVIFDPPAAIKGLKRSSYGQLKWLTALEYSHLRASGNPEKSRD